MALRILVAAFLVATCFAEGAPATPHDAAKTDVPDANNDDAAKNVDPVAPLANERYDVEKQLGADPLSSTPIYEPRPFYDKTPEYVRPVTRVDTWPDQYGHDDIYDNTADDETAYSRAVHEVTER